MTIGVVYQEIGTAAAEVAGAVEPLQKTLNDLSTILQSASVGFRGQAAAGFGEAITEWFEKAGELGPILEGYSQNLVGFAQEHLTNDEAQTKRYATMTAERLGPI